MQCNYTKSDGSQCKAHATKDDEYCFRHSKQVSDEEKRLASKKGGENRKQVIQEPLPPLSLSEPNHVAILLADTINRVRSGTIDLRTANCIGFLSGHLTRALEIAEVHQRLKRIEEVLNKKYS
jgi:hypothetical protein